MKEKFRKISKIPESSPVVGVPVDTPDEIRGRSAECIQKEMFGRYQEAIPRGAPDANLEEIPVSFFIKKNPKGFSLG